MGTIKRLRNYNFQTLVTGIFDEIDTYLLKITLEQSIRPRYFSNAPCIISATCLKKKQIQALLTLSF